MKPIAPQGEWLQKNILLGNRQIAIIFIGKHAKERAHSFLPELPYTMYLPFQTSPCAYTWPVNGCDIYLVDANRSSKLFIKKFVFYLFLQGATLINYVSSHFNQKFTRS